MRLRTHEHPRVGRPLATWLDGRLPWAEFAVQSSAHADVVVEAVAADGEPVAAAVATRSGSTLSGAPRFAAVVGPPEAAPALAGPIARRAHEEGGVEVLGAGDLPRALAAAVASATGGTSARFMQQRLMVATSVVAPGGVAGRSRLATADDHELLATWFDAFTVEALDSASRGGAHWETQARAAVPNLRVWEDAAGRPVSMALALRTTRMSSRVGPVYTPPEHRGHGYAAALTAHVTSERLASGDERVVLLTDADNGLTNRLYARVGYEDVGPHASWAVVLER